MSNPGLTSTTIGNVPTETPPKKGCGKFFERVGNWLTYKDKSQWLKDMRGNLSLVASIIATMTFQFAINPPGGVVQASDNVDIDCSNRSLKRPCPGQAVLAVAYKDDYLIFLVCNTICFIASLSVCLLLVSGLPLNHRFPTWLLSIGMCIILTSLALTYLYGVILVTPNVVLETAIDILRKVLWTWIALLGIISLLLTIRFLFRVMNKISECVNKCRHVSKTPGIDPA